LLTPPEADTAPATLGRFRTGKLPDLKVGNHSIDPRYLRLAAEIAEARDQPLSVYLEDLIADDYERETGRCAVSVYVPEPIDGDWTLMRDEGESDESHASGRETIELIMTALHRK
jgi:hypothetical protein